MTIDYFSTIMSGVPPHQTSGWHHCKCGGCFVIDISFANHRKSKRHVDYIKKQLLSINSN